MPKVSVSVSLPSSTASSATVTVKRACVASAAMVTLAGTPVTSSAARFAPRVATSGSTTSRSGAWLSRTVTATESPSTTESAARSNVADTMG